MIGATLSGGIHPSATTTDAELAAAERECVLLFLFAELETTMSASFTPALPHPVDAPTAYSWRGVEHTACFIGGAWVPAASKRTRDIVDPATGRVIARVAEGGSADVDAAVAAAAAAAATWAAADGAARGAVLRRLADLLADDAEHFATLEALDSGKPRRIALGADLASSVRVLRHHASLADARGTGGGRVIPAPASALAPGGLAYTVTSPLGVVGAITPFNFPLCGAVAKLAPALAAGASRRGC